MFTGKRITKVSQPYRPFKFRKRLRLKNDEKPAVGAFEMNSHIGSI